jgi:hypothetical protein
MGSGNCRVKTSAAAVIAANIAIASLGFISPVIKGRDGLFVLSMGMSNKSLIIILFAITHSVIRELAMKSFDFSRVFAFFD